MENKKTKIEMITEIKALLTNKEQIAFLDNEIALIKKKNAKRTPSVNQKENVSLKDIILTTLTDTPMSISDIQEANATLALLSNQRVSALLKQLVDINKVERVVDKKKVAFRKVA